MAEDKKKLIFRVIKIALILIVLLVTNVVLEEYRAKLMIPTSFSVLDIFGVLDTRATFAATQVAISVDAGPPTLIIDYPRNTTYYDEDNIPLNYTVYDSHLNIVWYNLDNGNNITLTNNITFSTSRGSHTLYLFANDTLNQVSTRNVTFVAGEVSEEQTADVNGEVEFQNNATKTIIPKLDGLTQNWNVNATIYSSTKPSEWVEEAPAENIVASKTRYIEISVSNNATTTAGGSYTIYFNATLNELSGLAPINVSLYIYENNNWSNLSTSVLDDDGDPIAFSAITTHFSKFLIGSKPAAAAPTPSPTPTAAVTGGGGGGGGVSLLAASFKLDQKVVKVLLKIGDSLKQSIKVLNDGNRTLTLNVYPGNLRNMIRVIPSSFTLAPNDEGTIDLNIIASEDTAPGVYTGEIVVSAGDLVKVIATILEIESKILLFDVSIDIPKDYKSIAPGADLPIHITLFNLGGVGEGTVNLEYSIKSMEGNTIIKKSEVINIKKQATISKFITLPKNVKEGDYVAIAQVIYEGNVGTSSEMFSVSKRERVPYVGLPYIGATAIIIVLILIVSLYIQQRRLKNIEGSLKKTIIEISRGKGREMPVDIREEKLRKQLNLLEKSYKLNYISKNAYERGRERIEDAIEEIKGEGL